MVSSWMWLALIALVSPFLVVILMMLLTIMVHIIVGVLELLYDLWILIKEGR